MRRLARGCTNESHPLYGLFMGQLSNAIFEWDEQDYTLLKEAKRAEMVASGIPQPSGSAVIKAITKDEMAKHCRRRTRGQSTTGKIEDLLLSLTSATDTLGVPVLGEDMKLIWEEEKKHVPCFQDPPNIQLYTKTGSIKKGGVELPVFRCARGSTSLESFHLHLNRFIPGTAANALHFQAYLLDGVTRWNEDRGTASITSGGDGVRSFDTRLKAKVEDLAMTIHGRSPFSSFSLPSDYTGELFGVAYLYAQSGRQLVSDKTDLDKDIDEGFSDDSDLDIIPSAAPDMEEEPLPVIAMVDSDSDEERVCIMNFA